MRPDANFDTLAGDPNPPVEELALALAAEFREPDVDGALQQLDGLGEQLAALADGGGPEAEAWACSELLGGRHGLAGDRDDYDNPDNSMLDLVLERRRGLPIALSVVYVAAARRAGIPLAGVGLPGHFVVAHFGASPPLVLDPFGGGPRGGGGGPPARPPPAAGARPVRRRLARRRAGSAAPRAALDPARDRPPDAEQPDRRL